MKRDLKKHSYWLLGIILISYFVVGFPDGAFTVSWLGISDDIPGMTTAHTGFILIAYSITYTLAGILLASFNKRLKLQTIYLIGLLIMGWGFISLALAPNFTLVLAAIAIYGFGTGAMASSMNSYMAKHFSASHNNWMHCFWGAGAAVSPMIMGRMKALADWRAGYYAITAILGVVGLILLISMYKKIWIDDKPETEIREEQTTLRKKYLTKKWHQVMEILIFFFLGGTDYTLVFFTGAALVARGTETIESVAIFSAVYYLAMTGGRMFFGWSAKWFRNPFIIRSGAALAVIGIGIIYFTGSVMGMALTGFGLGPLLPTLVSDTSNRFTSGILSKIVGLELAAFGAGIAVLFFLTSQIMHFVSYEALFPLGLAFIILVFISNEVLEYALKKSALVEKKETAASFKKVLTVKTDQ